MTTATDNSALSALFRPQSIAVFGASSDPTRVGGRPVANMLKFGFAGAIHPINPKYREIQGLKAFASLAEVPGAVDLAILAIPAAAVQQTLEDCAVRGVRAAIVFSSGYSEVGGEGEAAQQKLSELARRTGLRILGPNCLGMMNVGAGAICTFGQGPGFGMPPAGGISIVSQSGAFGTFTFIVARDRGLPVNLWASTGNEADIEFADCVDWLCDDPETQVIMGYMEGCRTGAKLVRALQKARAVGKPVVVMKVGRTEIGAAAARSHTSALAGSDAVYDCVFRQYGAHRAATVDEFFDVGYASLSGYRPKGRKLGIITLSGGAGVLMADAAEEVGLEVAPLPEPTQQAMRTIVPYAGVLNPVDITGQIANDRTLYRRFGRLMIAEGGYDAMVGFHSVGGLDPTGGANILDSWTALRQEFPEIPIFLSLKATPELARNLEAIRVPVFEEPTRMVRAVAALCRFGESAAAAETESVAATATQTLPDGTLSESAASALLSAAGIPMVPHEIADSAEAPVAAATRFGYPVALKIVSPDIAHKSDIGGVRLDLATPEAVADAYEAVLRNVRTQEPKARITGVLVAPMARDGVEAVVGVHEDPTFGPIVMVGLGGVLVEVLKDVAFRMAPFGEAEALRMIGELRGRALLQGVRGQKRADVPALARALARLSVLAAALAGRVASIEINPLLVRAEGKGVLGLDALVIGKPAAS